MHGEQPRRDVSGEDTVRVEAGVGTLVVLEGEQRLGEFGAGLLVGVVVGDVEAFSPPVGDFGDVGGFSGSR